MMLMKRLMDEFDSLARTAKELEEYELAQGYQLAESYANTCHGLSNDEIFERMRILLGTAIEASDGQEWVALVESAAIVKSWSCS